MEAWRERSSEDQHDGARLAPRLLQEVSGPQNKRMHLTVGALATSTAPPAGDAQRSADRLTSGEE
jgi:hypothetical protein